MFSVVTGGCGFIGSHLVDALVRNGDQVLVIDNLTTGVRDNIRDHLSTGAVELVHADLRGDGWQDRFSGARRVYHIAADPDVRESAHHPDSPVANNLVATARVLEAIRLAGVPELVFTSTSTVYGEATVIPTPEEYTPLEPISVYGATKLAAEALISAYCHSFGMKAWVFRFANIIGERSNHGVIWDFLQKLRGDPRHLEILGDGRQSKSYLEVHACVDAMLYAVGQASAPMNVLNIGSEDWIDVRTIADIVVGEMGVTGVRYHFTGGERGWVGDVPRMLLSLEKMKGLGWRPPVGSCESVIATVRALLEGH
ncbi:MAG: NAD-dependent epimerase/dehydratase family protein [Methanomicrobiales archaeon]|nr:NAD-dependent epimerase/dehydratase family protein [Methanomicrobiales archaeon]